MFKLFIYVFILIISLGAPIKFLDAKFNGEDNQTNVFSSDIYNRIVHIIDLREIYPNLTRSLTFDVKLVKKRTNFNRKFSLVYENEKFYFLASSIVPSIIRLNLFINSTLNDKNEKLKKIERVFNIRENKFKRIHTFEMKVKNHLEEVINSEELILHEFRNKLWQNNIDCPECLSILSIEPDGDNKYEIIIASTEVHNDLIDEICFLERIPNEYFNNITLRINRSSADCVSYRLPVVNSNQPEEYIIKFFYNVQTKPSVMTRMAAGWML